MKVAVTNDPAAVYTDLLAQRQRHAAKLEKQNARFAYGRLAIFFCAAVIIWLALANGYSILWVLVPVCAFVALMMAHERLMKRLERRRRAVAYFERGIARLKGEWQGRGEAGTEFLAAGHPYAQDLDLFGKGSLFELLSSARTHIGEATLAGWMLAPATPEIIRERQTAVDELRPKVQVREQLAVLAEDARSGVESASLAQWGEAPPMLASRRLRALIRVLRALGVIGLIAGFLALIGAGGFIKLSTTESVLGRDLFLLALVVNGFFYYRNRAPMDAVVLSVDEAAHELRLLSDVLALLEKQSFQAPLLARLRASLDSEGAPPSRRLARLGRIMDYLDSRENVFVRLLEPFILWTAYWAMQVEEWRKHSGPAVRRWLEAMAQIEALSSIAGYAYEHPEDPFPELLEGETCLQAESLGHPLIPERRVVRNNVAIGGELRILVVSGSNMSGKSTMLRTIGVNTVLAQMGAPVRAVSMRLSPLSVGASIRITDSLNDGISRFYAEILRLRQILDLTAGALPVLFLIDEFMHGTNSHDRRIGAEAMVRGLVARGAIGLITTHDLALAGIADELGPKAANVHFEDFIENGAVNFDYRMRPGVVRKSNAIELMRSVGLEV
jgi:hypothetical protein